MHAKHLMLLVLLAAPIAQANDALFPVDMLSLGKFDVLATLNHQQSSHDRVSLGNPGHETFSSTSESLQLRYGISDDWYVGGVLKNYSTYKASIDYSAPAAHVESHALEGGANPSLFSAYRLVNDSAKPYSVKVELFINPNTTGKYPSTYDLRLIAGYSASHDLRLYAYVDNQISADNSVSNVRSLNVGAKFRVLGDWSLIPRAAFTHFQSNAVWNATAQRAFGLELQIPIQKNTLLIPSLIRYQTQAFSTQSGSTSLGALNNGLSASLSLYHLYQ